MLQYKLQQAECMWGACAGGAAVCAGHAGLACMRQLCGMKVMLWCSSAAERCSALQQHTPLFPALTSANWPSHSYWRLCGRAWKTRRTRFNHSACHSNVVTSLAFLGLFGNSVPHTVGVAARIENACRLNAATVCPSPSSQQFKVSFMIMCMEVPHCSFFPIHTWIMSQRLWASMRIKHTKGPVAFC